MAKFYDALSDDHREFIAAQPIFFVASAAADGRVNLSPKGYDTVRAIDSHTVAYLDLTGSGNETAAHLRVDGRITIMWCSFAETPLIMRVYGHGAVVREGDAEWPALAAPFEPLKPGARQIIKVSVGSVQTSCGHAVPRMTLVGERDQLERWAEHKGPDGLVAYRAQKNLRSIDGLDVYGSLGQPDQGPEGSQ